MPYTLVKFLIWALLFAAIGGVVGWMLRSLTGRAELARVRAAGADQHELERLRARSADLDDVTAERDRLRMEIADVRGSSAGTLGFATTVDPGVLAAASAPVMSGVDDPLADVPTDDEDAAAEASATANDAEPSAGLATLIPAHGAGDGDDSADPGADEAEATPDDDGLDLDAAQRVLGRPIELDDLTAVEGIGPKIAQLCAAIGIDSWRSLAHSDVPTLRSMLDDAGARFKMHKPDSWPEQAALLADGRWEELVALTDRVDSGD